MATAAVPTGSTGTTAPCRNVSDEEKRWVVIGICLHKILTPALRQILSNEIPKWHQTLVKPPTEIGKQTFAKNVKTLPPSTIKLNYVSINNNTVHKSSKMYDYAVKDPLSLAKLFLKPSMAKFTGFDHTMDTSAVLSVMCEAQPFITCGADVLAKKVRSDVRNEWAHCDFLHWTEADFQTAIKDMESLVKTAGFTVVDEKLILDDLNAWEKTAKELCLGKQPDQEQLNLIQTEVSRLEDAYKKLNHDADNTERLLHSLQAFQSSLSREISDLRHRQEVTEETVGRLENKVAKLAIATDEIPYLFHAPKRNPWFGGRKSELQNVENLLQLNDASEQKVNIAAVCGLGGVGKTSLVTEYAHQKKNYYTGGVYWFSGEDDTTFESSVYDVATRFGTQSDSFRLTLSATLAMISQIKFPWLVVLDNMDQLNLSTNIIKLVSGSWQHGCTSAHLLITTRRNPSALPNEIRCVDERCCLSLKCFEIKEGKNFLFRRIGIQEQEVDILAEKLVRQLGGLPLALEQAGAYIKSLRCTLSQYLEHYDEQRLRLLNRQKAIPVSEYDSPERLAVRTTWHLNFEHIKQTDDGQAASRFLNACAFLSPNEIQNDIINIGNPPIEDAEFCECVKTSLGRQQVLKLLTDFSLFKETISSSLSVHHLVQEVIQSNLNPEEKLQSIIDAIRMLHYAFQSCSSPDELHSSEKQERPSVIPGDHSRFYEWHKLCSHSYELVKHLRSVLKLSHVNNGKILQPETARIMYECAVHLNVNFKHTEAIKVANFAKDVFNLSNLQVPASSHFPLTIPLREFIRRRIQYSCNAPESSKGPCGKSDLMPDHSVTFEELGEMRLKGNDLFKNGYYDDALTMYSKAIDMSKETNYFDARLLSNRASVYLKLEEYDKALQDAEEYILRRPRCWKGYARKALALVELESIEEACVPASIAYYYNRDLFRNYGPFMSRFGSLFEMRLFVCHDISDLSTALLKVKSQLTWDNKPDNSPIILLEPGDYHISIDTVDPSLISDGSMFYIRSCVLVGCESECTVSFDKTLHVAIMNSFVAYNVNFTNNQSVLKLAGDNFGVPPYTSLTCFGKLKANRCKFHNSIRGGLLVRGCAEVKNSEFFDNPGGLEVREDGRLLVRRSKVYGNVQGLLIGPGAKECVVEDCEVYDNAWGGIYVTNCASDVVIKGNRIYDNDESGISVIQNSNVSITDNEILSNNDWGIRVDNCSHAVVTKNRIANNKCGGICLDATSAPEKSVIEYNEISYNSGPGICDEVQLSKCKQNMLKNNKEKRNQSTAQSEAKLCYYCKKPEQNLKNCTNCFTAKYCGKQCQKNDWKSHKKVCGYLLSQASILLNYSHEPSMFGCNEPKVRHGIKYTHERAPGLLPIGPKHCPQPDTKSRFIVKMHAGVAIKIGRPYDPSIVTLYDRSLKIDGFLTGADQIYHLVRQHGSMGELFNYFKKLFLWVKGPEDGKLRVFINEFPPYQKW